MKKWLTILSLCLIGSLSAQKKLSITIDDVPSKRLIDVPFEESLISTLEQMQVPVTIFVNENFLTEKSLEDRMKVLEAWLKYDFVSIANHSYSHKRYSDIGVEDYLEEIEKGEVLSRSLAEKYNKELIWFRFPYNDLGKDSIQQAQIEAALTERGYKIAPFTFESSDWLFTQLYSYYSQKGDTKNAERIAKLYVEKTMESLAYQEKASAELFGDEIPQIYLCHDNPLNRDMLPALLAGFKARGYEIVPMSEAVEHPVYKKPLHYPKKWGISWVYRWIEDPEIQMQYLQNSPDVQDINKEWKEIQQAKSRESGK